MASNKRIVREDWACSIMAQALMDIKAKRDIPAVLEKVGRTAIGMRPDLMRTFKQLVKAKGRTL